MTHYLASFTHDQRDALAFLCLLLAVGLFAVLQAFLRWWELRAMWAQLERENQAMARRARRTQLGR